MDELNYESLEIESLEASVEQIETIEYVEIEDVEEVVVEIDEAFASLTSSGDVVKHNDLGGRDASDQHTIGAITGLEPRLANLEKLNTVYSNNVNYANYYMWQDENPNQENRDGYFVSMHQNDNKIRICKSDEDEFGVTVSGAGFIGNQNEEIPRGSNYGLVVHSGLVSVRCELDQTDSNQPCVKAGDYVASNNDGIAKKTDGTYGYRVSASSKIDGVWYAIISLTMPTTQMKYFSETAQGVKDRMGSAEKNIAAAISVANAAYNKAQVSQDWVQGNVENIAGDVAIIGDKIDNIITDVENLDTKVVGATIEALKAQSEASAVRTEANEANKATNSHISSLINALNPDKTWTDPENMDMWNDYFADYIKDGNIPTISQIKELDGGLQHANSMISQNALDIEHIVTSIDNYSVGEWSQAYGLNLAEAWNILKVGMIYIPTPIVHTEKYEYETIDSWGNDEEEIKKRDTNTIYMTTDDGSYWRYLPVAGDGNLTYEWTRLSKDYVVKDKYEFTRGYYYTWNGFYWVESESPYVYFSAAYPSPSEECQYWYVDSHEILDHEGVIYKARGLYKWNGVKWTEVNILAGNITNRAASSLIQTATEIAANVTNARGWLAHMGVRIDEDGSFVDQSASVVTPLLVNGEKVALKDECIFDEAPTDSIVGVEGQYYAVGTEQPYDVYIYQDETWQKKPLLYYDGVYIMKINTSSILLSANEDEAIVSVNGPTIFTADENGGVTGINGSCITTGTIASNDGTVKIDLGQGTAGISGKITATSGYIGNEVDGFVIEKKDSIYTYTVGTNGLSEGFYYFKHNNKYYSFEVTEELFEGTVIEANCNLGTTNISDGILTETEEPPVDSTLLTFKDIPYYYLGNNQISYLADGSGSAGVYVGPDGIGLGNGNFYVDNLGNLTTNGEITLKSNGKNVVTIDTNGNASMVGSIIATSGYIGNEKYGFAIEYDGNWVYSDGLNSSTQYYFQFDDVNYYFVTLEDISTDGILEFDSSSYQLTYKGVEIEYEKRESIPENTQLLELVNDHYYISSGQSSLKGSEISKQGVYISQQGIGLGNGNFYVDNYGNITTNSTINMYSDGERVLQIVDGSITMRGNINLAGSITWSDSINFIRVLYAGSDTQGSPTENYNDYGDEYIKSTIWHKVYDEDYDCYLSYSYDGGKTWDVPIRIKGEDGSNGINGDDATITSDKIFEMLTSGGDEQGLFPFTCVDENGDETNQLYINAEYIKAGTLSGMTIVGSTVTTAPNVFGDGVRLNSEENSLELLYTDEVVGEWIIVESGSAIRPVGGGYLGIGYPGYEVRASGIWDFSGCQDVTGLDEWVSGGGGSTTVTFG